MQKSWIGWAALGLCLYLPEAVFAQPTSQQQSAIRSNCRSDYMANCSSVKPGGIEALQCLQRNAAKLSSACRVAVDAVTPPAAPPQRTTSAPAAAPATAPAMPAPVSHPPAATPPPAAAPAHATASPPPPRQPAHTAPARAAAPPTAAPRKPTAQQQAAIRQSCQSDFMARCSGVRPGGAEALQCLQRHAAQVSPNCQRALASLGGGAPSAAPVTATAAPAIAPTAEQQNAIKFTCRRDFAATCRGVPPGGPEAFACLQRNSARLSLDCRTAVAAVMEGAPDGAGAAPAAAPAARSGPPPGPFPIRRAIRERMMHPQ